MDRKENGNPFLTEAWFLPFVFFVIGLSSILTQVVIIRELAAGFYGNEFFTGWAFFSWLLCTGLGSSFASSRPRKNVRLPSRLALFSFLVALLSFLGIVLIRLNHRLMGEAPGVLPDLVPSLAYSFAAIAPVCFLLGAQFSLAGRMSILARGADKPARTMGKAYLLETAGFIAGGIVFSFLLIRADAFLAMTVVIGANLLVAGLIGWQGRKDLPRLALLLFSLAVLVTVSPRLEKKTLQFRFPSEELVAVKNTLRGNIAITRLKGQYNFYQNGMLLGAAREEMASEYLVHFPMLAHSAPKIVLLLGTGFNGPLKEILRHGPEKVVAVELDPEIDNLAAPYLPEDLRKVLDDPRVRFWHGDSRAFFRGTGERFDVIIANFPDPLSILIDRNYTGEFFRLVRDHLTEGGVFATKLGFAANYVSPELERLGSSVYATLHDAFTTVKVLPEDTAYFLASSENTDFGGVEAMVKRIRDRGLTPGFATAEYLRYRFANDRVDQVRTVFENSVWKVKNTDLKPKACYFAFTRWLSQFHPRASQALLGVSEVPFAMVLAGLLLFFACPVFFRGTPYGNARRLSLTAMRTAGFTVMAFEITLIYLFQAFLGDLYYRIAVLVTVLMTGIGIGSWAAVRLPGSPSARAVLAGIHFVSAGFFIALTVTIHGLRNVLVLQGAQEVLFYGFAVLGGALAGFEFPVASDFYLNAGKGDRAGAVYAADLLGSCLGALLTAGFLLPVWGVKKTLILLAALNGMMVLFLLFRKNLRGEDL